MDELRDKLAITTGAGSGIGRAWAGRFAGEAAAISGIVLPVDGAAHARLACPYTH